VQLPDVNVLVYAFSRHSEFHEKSRRWLEDALSGGAPLGMSELVCSSVVRVATNPRAAVSPARIDDALDFVNEILNRDSCRRIRPGERHFEIFTDLCLRTHVRWNDVTDAYFAALAIESGCEWVTYDRGFARFPGLRWRRPLD